MSKDTLQVQKILSFYLEVPMEELRLDARFSHDLGVDSLCRANMITALERVFGVKFPNDPLELETVRQVVEYLRDHGVLA